MRDEFRNWMIQEDGIAEYIAYQYVTAIDKISEHYNEQTGANLDIYKETDLKKLKEIANEYGPNGKYADFSSFGNGMLRNAIKAYIEFLCQKFGIKELEDYQFSHFNFQDSFKAQDHFKAQDNLNVHDNFKAQDNFNVHDSLKTQDNFNVHDSFKVQDSFNVHDSFKTQDNLNVHDNFKVQDNFNVHDNFNTHDHFKTQDFKDYSNEKSEDEDVKSFEAEKIESHELNYYVYNPVNDEENNLYPVNTNVKAKDGFKDFSNSYEKDIQMSLIYKIDELFPGYRIFGKNKEGINYEINGRTIYLLLENPMENSLLVVEINAGRADYKTFGKVAMYIGMLSKEFPTKFVKGLIISGEIDDSLVNATRITDRIKVKTYQMKLSLRNII
ncbi:MAG TPA: hypothetical protein PLL17_03395 [Defluviitaleaceae bacterium]|nr:hypothetical protein [Defluviitaleaceae bacterium]